MMNKVIEIFRSLRFTVFLILCLVIVFIIGLLVPQKRLIGMEQYFIWKSERPDIVSFLDSVGFTDIYTSTFTLILWVLFFLNLLGVMTKRIPLIWRRCFRKDFPSGIESIQRSAVNEVIETDSTMDIERIFRKNGYNFFYQGNSFWAVRNRLSPLATILFHMSFFLILLGGVTSFYTKFKAEAYVASGETFTGNYNMVSPPKIGDIPHTVFSVMDIKPKYYDKDIPVDLRVTLSTKKGIEVIGINKPYKEGPLSFVITNLDVSPLFIIKNIDGQEIDGAYVKLNILSGKEDFFEMAGYRFRVIFYTNYSASFSNSMSPDDPVNIPQALKQSPVSERPRQQKEIVEPAVHLDVIKGGRLINSGIIKLGQSIKFDGHELSFSDFTYWLKFYVVKEYGLEIVYAGFFIAIIALIIRFAFYRRDIKGMVLNGKLHIGGRSEFYSSLFEEEFRQILAGIRR